MSESETTELWEAFLRNLVEAGYIQSSGVKEAFRTIPRHLFVPGVEHERVYSDNSIPTKRADGKLISSSSQPAIMAIMLEQLQLQPGHRVLEIGAGTGYNAGLMQHIVGDSGLVVTVDIDDDIVADAREHLSAAGLDRVKVICGDGYSGYTDDAPYDRIILTAGAWDIAPAWLDQLQPGGRLLLPLEIKEGIQKSIAFDRVGDHLESVSVKDCGFMALRGAFAKPQNRVCFGPESAMGFSANEGVQVDGSTVYRLLNEPGKTVPSGVEAYPGEIIFGGLALRLSLREPGLCLLSAEGKAAEQGIVPRFFVYQGGAEGCGTIGLIEDGELCVFVPPPGVPAEQPDGSGSVELFVRSYGTDTGLAERLAEQVVAWDVAGRPSSNGLYIKAYSDRSGYTLLPDEYLIEKQWTKLVLGWK